MELVKKVLEHLINEEKANGSDQVAEELEDLLKDLPTDPEEIAVRIYDIYEEDRDRVYDLGYNSR